MQPFLTPNLIFFSNAPQIVCRRIIKNNQNKDVENSNSNWRFRCCKQVRHVTAHELGHLMNGLFMMLLLLSIWPAPMPYWSLLFSRKSDGATLI